MSYPLEQGHISVRCRLARLLRDRVYGRVAERSLSVRNLMKIELVLAVCEESSTRSPTRSPR
jgi:hypothetical protein